MSRGRPLKLVRRWRELPAADRAALRSAAPRLLLVRTLLAVLGVARSQRFLGRRAPTGAATLTQAEPWHRRAAALRRAARWLPGDARCVARSVTLWWWMRGAGLAPTLHMGVRRDSSNALDGHAWVVCDGQVIGDSPALIAAYRELEWPSPP